MSENKPHSPEEMTANLERMKDEGVQLFDLRGKSPEEQAEMVAEIKQAIAEARHKKSIPDDCPTCFVACSGKTQDAEILKNAREVGQRTRAVITGASQKASMGAVAAGAEVEIGVTREMIAPIEPPDNRYDIVVMVDGKKFDGLDNRVKLMHELAGDMVTLEGGMGTLEEILGAITGDHGERARVQLITPYWQPMVAALKTMHAYGYGDSDPLAKIHCFDAGGMQTTAAPVVPLSEAEAQAFRKDAEEITGTVAEQLSARGKAPHVLNGKKVLKQWALNQEAFLLPPTGIDGIYQAVLVACEKRMANNYKNNAPNPLINRKPLIVLNIDGFYDQFMQQWRAMEAGGHLSEELSSIVTEVKIERGMSAPEIRTRIAAAMPLAIGHLQNGSWQRK